MSERSGVQEAVPSTHVPPAVRDYLRLLGLWLWFGLLGWGLLALFLAGPLLGVAGADLATGGGAVSAYAGSFAAAWIGTSLAFAEVSRRLIPRRRALEPLRVFVRAVSGALLLAILACVVRFTAVLIPEMTAVPAIDHLNRAMGPLWHIVAALGTQLGLPAEVRGVSIGPPLFFGVLILARNAVNWRLEKVSLAEFRKSRTVEPKKKGSDEAEEEVHSRAAAMARRVAVSSYTEAKSILEETQVELTFLSLDIVGSTTMKQGEDPYVIEKAFSDYRKLVERKLRRFEAYKQTWTPDGQMAAFRSPQAAVDCGREVLEALADFNDNVSKLSSDFALRVGANVGVVSTDDRTPMEEISDFSIDVAGHLQKHAETNTLWISGEVYEKLDDAEGFEQIERTVDGRTVYEWRM